MLATPSTLGGSLIRPGTAPLHRQPGRGAPTAAAQAPHPAGSFQSWNLRTTALKERIGVHHRLLPSRFAITATGAKIPARSA
jgi:hypothetical protein